MGLTINSKNHSIDLSYSGFYRLRVKVAELTAPDIYEHYKKLNKELQFAKYSTEAKAEKAMEMCRNRYAWCKMRNNGMNSLTMAMSFRRTDEIEQLLETFAEKNIFQFPADEEVD